MGKIVKTGVIGHPVAHSKSPLIHNYWIGAYGLAGAYEAIDVPCGALEDKIRALQEEGYAGFNVTVPHKADILQFCDEIDDLARVVGAINTVTIEDGQLKGANTDVFGFLENIRQRRPGFDFAAGPAAVLGAGGAARGVVCGLLQAGVPAVRIANRTRDRAEALKDSFPGIEICDWEERSEILKDANLLVNATSLGMEGKPPLEIDLTALPETALVTDIVYAPLETDLLKQAAARGNPVVTGIGMLLHQARPGFELWHGVMPEVTEELERMVSG